MITIPLSKVPRQSLSVLLEDVLYQISVKECNGIMAVTIANPDKTLVENRRAVPFIPIIPPGPRETGNFIFSTLNDAMPYYDQFDSQQLLYLTIDEVTELKNS